MREEIASVKNEAVAQIIRADSNDELEQLRINYLGRSGKVTALFKRMGHESGDKKLLGLAINEAKDTIIKLLAEQKNKLKVLARDWFDPTVPGLLPETGSLHLITQAISEISDVFKQIGFVRVRYPEVEWDWFAFGSLNFTPDHPARDEWETFLVDTDPSKKYGPMVLTPHTSSGQVREMKRVGTPPIRMINIGKCYRRQSDASHVPMFHQFEGLVIDHGIAITHLKATLDHFARHFYGPKIKTRLRPYNFPFTEPSFEVDFVCTICEGKGCKVCKGGWLEMGGAGMVHPNVLKAGGIDPKKYTGFAFGWGVERVAMMRPGLGIPDLRLLYSTDLRYLRQF